MVIFKCKMCGGDLHPVEGASTCECEYCGSLQTIPTADNEKKMNLFGRAQRLLRACEFSKASGVYESIVAEFPEEAEAYWGLVLCKYGIEYVDDPGTGKKVPTCHRTRSESILDDSDFEQACENADSIAKRVYRESAKEIDKLQQDILSIVANESPYDVFICYKETDEDGNRTEDSVLAQEVYNALVAKELRVFFARITLEDKIGQQYEPYIYAALHSAKVMIVIGTRFEYYDAIWVKNEWSRFIAMMAQNKAKSLIPCYKNIDAYDMPREFKNLQAQDMGKLGWLQDLTRGVLKLCGESSGGGEKGGGIGVNRRLGNLMGRADSYLQASDWMNAINSYSIVLDTINEKYAPAFIGILCAKLELNRPEELAQTRIDYSESEEWKLANEYASKEQREKYNSYLLAHNSLIDMINEQQKEENYQEAIRNMNEDQLLKAIWGFDRNQDYKDSQQNLARCLDKLNSDLRNQYLANPPRTVAEYQKKIGAAERRKNEEEKKTEQIKRKQIDLPQENASIEKSITDYTTELNRLTGLFTGKKRREIQTSIDALKRRKESNESELRSLGQSLNATETELTRINAEIIELKEKLKKEQDNSEYKEKTIEEVRKMEDILCNWGRTIRFGEYFIHGRNKKEQIVWLIKGWNDTKLYLVSKYILDLQEWDKRMVNQEVLGVKWEDSDLHHWFNSYFYNTAFSDSDKQMIVESRLMKKEEIPILFPPREDPGQYGLSFAKAALTPFANNIAVSLGNKSFLDYCWIQSTDGNENIPQVVNFSTEVNRIYAYMMKVGDRRFMGVRPYAVVQMSSLDFKDDTKFGSSSARYGLAGSTFFEDN